MCILNNKKGISGIITTVFIILLTVAAVGIIAAVLISFTRNSLNESTRCMDVKDEITIIAEGSCYNNGNGINPNTKNTSIQIRFGKVNVTKIYIGLEKNGNTETNEISYPELPTPNGGRKTYTFTNINSSFANVGAFVQDKKCEPSYSAEIMRCRL